MASYLAQTTVTPTWSPWTLHKQGARSRQRHLGRARAEVGLADGQQPVLETERLPYEGDYRHGAWSEEEAKCLDRSRHLRPEKFEPERVNRRYRKLPIQTGFRALQVGAAASRFMASILTDFAFGKAEERASIRGRELRNALTGLGPAFIKVGQALSTRPDVISAAYANELAGLQDDIPSFESGTAFAIVEEELDTDLGSLFESVTAFPIASASLGQVYKARTRDGKDVAVKVQRPGVRSWVFLDFYLIRNAAGLFDSLGIVSTSLQGLIDEFATKVSEEMDYIQEGRNAERFDRLFGSREDIVVPQIVWSHSSPKVLTLQWIEGTKLDDVPRLQSQGLDVLGIVQIGISCSIKQLLEAGYFHAGASPLLQKLLTRWRSSMCGNPPGTLPDPHPGNLLATDEGKLAFLDFGMMSVMPARARYALTSHVVHLVNRDFEAMVYDYFDLGFLEGNVDPRPIIPALESFFGDVLKSSVSELNFKAIVDGLGDIFYRYPFTIPSYYALITRSLSVLEGIALRTDPGFKLLERAYPNFARRLLMDPAPELRTALAELLFKGGRLRWDRLRNLLEQGSRAEDWRASQALSSLLVTLLLEPGTDLSEMVEREAIRVAESFILAPPSEVERLLTSPLARRYLPNELRNAFLEPWHSFVHRQEAREMRQLREQALSCWFLLDDGSTSAVSQNDRSYFTEAFMAIMDDSRVRTFSAKVGASVTQRLFGRGVRLSAKLLE